MELPPTFKKKRNYFICGKLGHHAPQCRHRAKNDNPSKTNITEGEDITVAVVSQVNLVTSVSKMGGRLWGYQTHLCKHKCIYLLHKCGEWRKTSLSR